jgi:hypothetical protein
MVAFLLRRGACRTNACARALKPYKLVQPFKPFIPLIMATKQPARKAVAPAPAAKKPAKTVAAAAPRKTAMPASAPSPQVPPAAPKEPLATTSEAAKPAPQSAKVVRDGFTMPQVDYDLLKSLKAQCLKAGVEVKKSELLRAGVQALAALSMTELAARLKALPPVKAGRRKNKD